MPQPSGPAKLYVTSRKDTPFQVVYPDPLKRVKTKTGWRSKRVVRWFAQRDGGEGADAFLRQMNRSLLIEGAKGVHFDVHVRADAMSARQLLDAAGHNDMSLRQLALNYCERVQHHAASGLNIGPEVEAFLREKEMAEGKSAATVNNLRVRLWRWINREKIKTVGEVTRDRVEPLRTGISRKTGKALHAQTRRNDINAVSSFCTYLVDKRKLDHHPLKGLRRPHVPYVPPPILTTDECQRLLEAVRAMPDDDYLATVAVMMFVGPRPSELPHTALFYGRQPMARIEGGKLRGRANRVVPLSPAAVAWLKAAGSPASVAEWNKHARNRAMEAAGLTWKVDLLRHTCISNWCELEQNDALVARRAGTSETMIQRRYRRLVTPAAARAWNRLRPAKNGGLTSVAKADKTAA